MQVVPSVTGKDEEIAWVKCTLMQSRTEVLVAPGDRSPSQLSASQPQLRTPFLWHPLHRKLLSAPKGKLLCFSLLYNVALHMEMQQGQNDSFITQSFIYELFDGCCCHGVV